MMILHKSPGKVNECIKTSWNWKVIEVNSCSCGTIIVKVSKKGKMNREERTMEKHGEKEANVFR